MAQRPRRGDEVGDVWRHEAELEGLAQRQERQ